MGPFEGSRLTNQKVLEAEKEKIVREAVWDAEHLSNLQTAKHESVGRSFRPPDR